MRMAQWRCSWVRAGVLLALCCALLQPAGAATSGVPADHPKIGLALSGGGARGAAHVGVLRVLEEMRIPIDYIAGTSMGSIIGGLYASGMTPDEIETALETMDWEHIFDDAPPRAERSFRRKRDDDLYLVKAKPGISDQGELKFPTGAVQGQKFALVLRELTLPITTLTDFDRLHIPFRAVASDISNGHSVVLGSGDLVAAMRASMAVPGAFAAVDIDGRLLVDGGITNNLPIDVVRDMGADIVIAVDISTPYMPAEEVNNLFKITAQLTSIMTRTNVEQRLATLTDRDILIVPDLGDLSSSDFERAAEAVLSGRAAADAHRAALARLALSGSAYREHLAARAARPSPQPPVVDFVRIENDSPVADGVIRARLRQGIGVPLERQQLDEDIGRIYGLELFQTVRYDLVEEDGKTGLVVVAQARRWGPNYLQLGLQMNSDMDGGNAFNLGAAYLRTAINPLGGELRLGLQLGEEPSVGGDWHQPLDVLSRYFVASALRYGMRSVDVFDGRDDRVAEYRVSETALLVAMGREFDVYGEGRVGYRYRTGDVELRTGAPDLAEFDYTTADLYARVALDRLDNYNFPEQGSLASFEYAFAREAFGGDADFDQLTARGSYFTTLGAGHVLGAAGLLGMTLNGDADVQNRYRLGGFLSLSGFSQDALSGQQAGTLTAIYYRRFKIFPFLSWYAGGSLEYGGVWEEQGDLFDDGIAAGSLFLGADTPIGPAYLGYGHAEGGHNSIFFYLGRPFFR